MAAFWRPIETLPEEFKDGRSVLLCVSGYEPAILEWRTEGEISKWVADPEVIGDEKVWLDQFQTEYQPTHWMPLMLGPEYMVEE